MSDGNKLCAGATAPLTEGGDNSVMVLASHAGLGNLRTVAALRDAFKAPAPAIRDGGIVDDWEQADAAAMPTPPGRVVLLVQHGAPPFRVHLLMRRIRVLFNPGDIAVAYVAE